ncbi:MAG: hypothetical protein AUK48_11395 [Oscillatoriales cyanobacterium CG2_30_44_21]|nr:MAG: hypothetical protein AUK48_11395 [Oscillatoriales cyanobacterium CG2_30_44_21]
MKIVAIALAGGKSSRMGTDKALLEIDGETLLAKVCHVASQVTESVYVVVRSCEQYQAAIASSEYISVVDRQLTGALVGFLQGLEVIAHTPDSINPDWILLLACDLPNLKSDVLKTWAAQLADLPEDAIAYLPKHIARDQELADGQIKSKQWEPLCGFYRWECQKSLMEFVEGGGRSFQKWLKTQQVIEIAKVDANILFNCNTVADLLWIKR